MTFEQAHPDTARIIEERGYATRRYERYCDGNLLEVWEKQEDGTWKDISMQELLKLAIEKEKAEIARLEQLEKIRALREG